MGWKEKFISKAGWEILIKTVAQAIPTYTMGIFKLPESLCDDINSTLANIGGGRQRMRKRFIGSIGVNFAGQRIIGGWVLEISMLSI